MSGRKKYADNASNFISWESNTNMLKKETDNTTNPKKQRIECNRKTSFEGFFTNHNFYVHSAALSKNRRVLFEKQITSNGGHFIHELATFKKQEKVIVLLDDELINKERIPKMIQKLCQLQATENCFQFLALRWLYQCLEKDCYITPDTNHRLTINTSSKCILNTNDEAKTFEEKDSTPLKNNENVGDRMENRFVCAHSSNDPRNVSNINLPIIEELSKLSSAYKNTNDQWRCFAYDKAISSIRRHPTVIGSRAEAAKIRGVGEKMADKIAEILNYGSLQKVKEVGSDEKTIVLELFNRIWGVGPSTAEQWYCQGLRSLEDLKRANSEQQNFLNKHQKIGLDLFDDLDERMDRSEAAQIETYVRNSVLELNSSLEVIACGSFRRGKGTCGDLDILITHPNEFNVPDGLFQEIITKLHNERFLTHDLTFQKDGNQKKYLGVCKLPNQPGAQNAKHRRLDIIVVPPTEKATAMLYFTGSAHFNRSMRLMATKKGMSLSEHALRKNVVRGGLCNKEKLNEGMILETPNEQSVFQHLGLSYREPSERDH